MVGYAVLVGLGFANAQAGYPVSHDWPRVFRTTLVAAVFLLLSAEVVPATGWVGIPARIALLAAVPARARRGGRPQPRRTPPDRPALRRHAPAAEGKGVEEAVELEVEQEEAQVRDGDRLWRSTRSMWGGLEHVRWAF